LTTTVLVARNPALQAKDLIRYTVKLDGQNLWVTAVENTQGKIEYPVTIKFARA
jgi:hypothetical protein